MLSIVATAFVRNYVVDGRGSHLDIDRPQYFYAYGVSFEPFEPRRSVSLPILAGCEQFSCSRGEACSYTQYSLRCSPCADGTVGLDNVTCTACEPGKQASSDKTACVECGDARPPRSVSASRAAAMRDRMQTKPHACSLTHARTEKYVHHSWSARRTISVSSAPPAALASVVQRAPLVTDWERSQTWNSPCAEPARLAQRQT
jgi:hypothetical protein